MTTLLTSELIDRCHAGSRAKGFWDETPPKGQQLMLVISELSEALEAHRKGRTAYLDAFQKMLISDPKHPWVNGDMPFPAGMFQELVKDTPADELADAYIRLCDFAGGYQLNINSVIRHHQAESADLNIYPENFGTALLGLTMLVCSILEEGENEGVGTALAALEYVAKNEGIDLATHIDLKLRYNATRPVKHGKAY